MQAETEAAGNEPWILDLGAIGPDDRIRAGGKAVALAALQRSGLRVPQGLCVLTSAYERFVNAAGLRAAIRLELGRKAFEDMRWEEMWDASLRIRNLFLRAPVEPGLAASLEAALARRFGDGRPAVVRSSAPSEDTAATSFAGLHESYVNVRNVPALLEAVRLVWASLWTDRALLYRQELGLDVLASSMAVVVQELISGEASGIAFSENPVDDSQAVVEAVWGLNEGLVDGAIEPDRWTVERETGILVEHIEPVRKRKVVLRGEPRPGDEHGPGGTRLVDLPSRERLSPPLSEPLLRTVLAAASEAEDLFGMPQDMEWTVSNADLWVLQSRPISTARGSLTAEADAIAHERALEETRRVSGETKLVPGRTGVRDERPWYVNLRKSFKTLRELRHQVEDTAIPQMTAEADSMGTIDLAALSDDGLAAETARRKAALAHWEEVYYRDFVPLAHGVRLFGQVYNDNMRPTDPYEFVDLLAGSGLQSVSRNTALKELADQRSVGSPEATAALDDYLDRFGSGPGTPESVRVRERAQLARLLSEMAEDTVEATSPSPGMPSLRSAPERTSPAERAEEYLRRFGGDERRFQEELLDLARASYRLRDDDNLYLGRFQTLLEVALAETRARAEGPIDGETGAGWLGDRGPGGETRWETLEVQVAEDKGLSEDERAGIPSPATRFRVRQLVGQPAGPGLAVGRARVAIDRDELYDFARGEILVCDSLDPTMTFVAPLAAAIVERRGGMLVHGAIIAREYGLPCVTGVPEATEEIHTGDLLTVDGFLGIVVVGGTPPGTAPPARF